MALEKESLDEGFDVVDIAQILWRDRWIILAACVVCVAAGIAYALVATKWYRAEVKMVQSESKALPGGLGQLGGLASLAGINIGSSGGDSQTPLAVLRSKEFIRQFIEDQKLLTVVLRHRWDADNKRWKSNDPTGPPDIRDAVEYFDRKIRDVSQDVKSGVVTLSIRWEDANSAALWANELADRVNVRLRVRTLTETDRTIKYLQGEMSSTNVTVLQQSIGKVLESEMQRNVLARGDEEFAFKVVDRAFPPRKPVWPRPVIVGVASALLGIVFGVVFVLMRASLRTRARR